MIPAWKDSFDPANIDNYLFSFELDTGETIATAAVTLDAASLALGLLLGSGATGAAVIGSDVRFWLTCSAGQQANPAFLAGHEALVTATITTSASPARTLQKTGLLLVRQSDSLITALAPVTLAEAKAWLREEDDETANDATIVGLIRAAAAMIEQITGLAMRAREMTQACPVFGARVVLFKRPVVSIEGVEYDASDGTVKTLDPSAWRLREFAGQPALVPAFGNGFPATEDVDGAVRVTLVAGYASNAEVPEDIKQAALLMIGHWFSNREAVVTGTIAAEVPLGARALLQPYRRGMLG